MLKFERVDYPYDESLIEPLRLNDVIVGKWAVMYGFRLRAGFVEEDSYELDICCGDKEVNYLLMLAKVTSIIVWNIERGLQPFHDIPKMSRIKPYTKDDEFNEKIDGLFLKATTK